MSASTMAPLASHAAQLAAQQIAIVLDRMMLALTEGQEDVTPYLKLAGRNAAILARHALHVPEDRPTAEALLDRVIEAAELADDQALERRPTILGYLVIITSCIDWLAKLEAATRREQQRTARDTQKIASHVPTDLAGPSPLHDAVVANDATERVTPWPHPPAYAPPSPFDPGG